jgi:hypothetical protein
MSNIRVAMNGDGKYRITMFKVPGEKMKPYIALDISVSDWGGRTTLVFNTMDQVAEFLKDVTQAMLTCATKVSDS